MGRAAVCWEGVKNPKVFRFFSIRMISLLAGGFSRPRDLCAVSVAGGRIDTRTSMVTYRWESAQQTKGVVDVENRLNTLRKPVVTGMS